MSAKREQDCARKFICERDWDTRTRIQSARESVKRTYTFSLLLNALVPTPSRFRGQRVGSQSLAQDHVKPSLRRVLLAAKTLKSLIVDISILELRGAWRAWSLVWIGSRMLHPFRLRLQDLLSLSCLLEPVLLKLNWIGSGSILSCFWTQQASRLDGIRSALILQIPHCNPAWDPCQ